ncbi:MAG: glycosyltransferase family 4 protein [Acidimicrobiales bacterium]
MRIAQVAPLYESVPPEAYGGTERVIAALCDGLTARGHDVVLFAADASETTAALESYGPPLRRRLSRDELVQVAPHLHLHLLEDVFRRADEFDVVHSHVDVWTLPFTEWARTPTVVTLHGRLDIAEVRRVLPLYPDVAVVSISDAQRTPLDGFDVRWAATVYNGLDLSSYAATGVERGDHLAFLGRINPEKRPDLAIEVARRTGRPLQIAAKVDPTDVEYHQAVIEPLLGGDVEFLGEIDEELKAGFLASAAATLFPSDWPEPFGLVMLESMAAGTPVIALRRGSVPEVLVDGVSGFICDDVDDMVDAVGRIDELQPEMCQRQAECFDVAAMCDGYERVYEALVHDHASAAVEASS